LPPLLRPPQSSPRFRRSWTVLAELRVDDRLARLGDRCRLLELGLDNADRDPALVFSDLRYRDVMPVAMHVPAVARAIAKLPADWRWADE
jgi:hypothetical protein